MKNVAMAALSLLAIASTQPAAAASQDDLVGKWKWTDIVLEVAKCADNPAGAGICAKIVAGPKNVGMELIRSKLEQKGDEFLAKTAHPLTTEIYNTRIKLVNADNFAMDGCTDGNVCAKADFVRVK